MLEESELSESELESEPESEPDEVEDDRALKVINEMNSA